MFVGREKELDDLNRLYHQDRFQMFVLYGRRRVGKTTLLIEFCKDKDHIFYSAEQSNDKRNLEKFSQNVFAHYGETTLEPFSSWENALEYIDNRQKNRNLVIVLDEFPYLANQDKALLSRLQHMIDHRLQYGRLFLVLCGSYMGFMEKDVLGEKSPIFGRRTGQLRMKPFDYRLSCQFLKNYSREDQLMLYGAFGGTPLYLQQIDNHVSVEENIKRLVLEPTGYLYEEPHLLLGQEIQEPGIYNAIIEAIASGASKSNEIASRTGEESSKCLKYINTLIELGILHREVPFGEKKSSRKTIYRISDFMFRFWYRYVAANRTLLETGAQNIVWDRRIRPDYSNYMGLVFEQVCKDYLLIQNVRGKLPILFTAIGRWWGTDTGTRQQVEIDLVAKDGNDYLICECKWRNELLNYGVLEGLKKKADAYSNNRGKTYYVLLSKSGFTQAVKEEAEKDRTILLVTLDDIFEPVDGNSNF